MSMLNRMWRDRVQCITLILIGLERSCISEAEASRRSVEARLWRRTVAQVE